MENGNKIIEVRQHCIDRYVEGHDHGQWIYFLWALLEDGTKVLLDREKVRAAARALRLTEAAARRTCVGEDVDQFL